MGLNETFNDWWVDHLNYIFVVLSLAFLEMDTKHRVDKWYTSAIGKGDGIVVEKNCRKRATGILVYKVSKLQSSLLSLKYWLIVNNTNSCYVDDGFNIKRLWRLRIDKRIIMENVLPLAGSNTDSEFLYDFGDLGDYNLSDGMGNETLNHTQMRNMVQDHILDTQGFPDRGSILLVVLYVPAFCAGFIGNGLLAYIVTTHRRLRNSTNLFLCNLAVADLCGRYEA